MARTAEYNTVEKQRLFRDEIWMCADWLAKPRALRTVAVLEVGSALEVRQLLRLGYSAQNIWAINKEKAYLARMTRSLTAAGLPSVNRITGDFFETCEGVGIEFDVISFDSTSRLETLSGDLVRLVKVMPRTGVLAVNVCGGREQGDNVFAGHLASLKRHVGAASVRSSRNRVANAMHRYRVSGVWACATAEWSTDGRPVKCVRHVRHVRWGNYPSAKGRPMVWTAGLVVPHSSDLRTDHLAPAMCLSRSRRPYEAYADLMAAHRRHDVAKRNMAALDGEISGLVDSAIAEGDGAILDLLKTLEEYAKCRGSAACAKGLHRLTEAMNRKRPDEQEPS
jgi:hypothetical protein